jgi:excisionase family DNA binding protein
MIQQIEVKEQPIARSVEDTARLAGVGRTTVFEAIRTGQLRARKIGRRTVILDQDSRAWLNAMPLAGQTSA